MFIMLCGYESAQVQLMEYHRNDGSILFHKLREVSMNLIFKWDKVFRVVQVN